MSKMWKWISTDIRKNIGVFCYYCFMQHIFNNMEKNKNKYIYLWEFVRKHYDSDVVRMVNLCDDYWFPFGLVLGIATYYFYNLSFWIRSISLFIFTVLYGFIGMNIFFVRVLDSIHFDDFFSIFLFTTPFYFIGSILGFIKLIKHFNKNTSDDTIR